MASLRRLLCLWLCAAGLAVAAAESTAPASTSSFQEIEQKALAGEPLRVVFFGGSLTWGANASDPQRTSWRALMGEWLRERYPKCPFAFYDATIGGTGSRLGLFRLERDVLAHRPDLVFFEFTMNDGAEASDPETLASYEALLRQMVGAGIAVEQVFTCFKYHFHEGFDPQTLPRYVAHRQLAEAYHTAVGDALARTKTELAAGRAQIATLWPFDGAHPDDPGYRLFFEAVREGFEQAVQTKRTAAVPEHSLFPDLYQKRSRILLAKSALPAGWAVRKTYRTSLWFDGLTSRWMDDVAAFGGDPAAPVTPLRVPFSGTFVGLFGERNAEGLAFKARVDGQPMLYRHDDKSEPTPIWPNDTSRMGSGNLFSWIVLSDKLTPGPHVLEIEPLPDPSKPHGELRFESVCAAGE